MLHIDNISVEVENKQVISNLSLLIKKGECHAIMGPNGAGKSTLVKVLAGHPSYVVTEGAIYFEGVNLLELEPEERARMGLIISFQYPIEIPGISNKQFLFEAYKAKLLQEKKEIPSEEEFTNDLIAKAEKIGLKKEFLERSINEGFSGGEKKKNEILQAAILSPVLSVLDETDSGLDIDSLKMVASGINAMRDKQKAFLLVTHYQRLLDYVKPDKVHVMKNGALCHSGDASLALQLEEKGYDWIEA